MSSDTTKVPSAEPESNEPEGWTIGGRATPDEIRTIDIASAIAGKKRGPWMIEVCVEKAQETIAQHSRSVVNDAAA